MPFRRCASQVHDRATPTNAKPVPRYAMPSPRRAPPSKLCRRCAPLCPAGTAPSFAAAWQSKAVPMRGGTLRFPRCAAPISANAQRAYALPQQCPAGRCDAAAMRRFAKRCLGLPCDSMHCKAAALLRHAVPLPCVSIQCVAPALPRRPKPMPCPAEQNLCYAHQSRGLA